MNEWSAVAKVKLANIIRRDDFEKIASVSFEFQVIKLKGEYCKVDKFGRVEWDTTGKFKG